MVELRERYPVKPEVVWRSLSDPTELSAWFGAEVRIELRPGGRATFRWPDGRERGAVVERVEVDRLLSFRWLPFEMGPNGDRHPAPWGRVELELAATEDGTELRVVEWGRDETNTPGFSRSAGVFAE